MCGRITQQLSPDQMASCTACGQRRCRPIELPRYNGAPGQTSAPAGLSRTASRAIVRLRWGLVPSWARDARMGSRLINARAESVHYKPSFRAAFRLRRCLLPVDGWFEWQSRGRGKQPYFLTLKDGSPLSFAALWERWDPGGASNWRPSPSLPRRPPQAWKTSTIASRRSSNPSLVQQLARPADAAAGAARAGAGTP